jgi:hypothetical protein
MNEYEDVEFGTRILPGVDLALWLRLVGLVILAALAVGITVAVS